jgi:CO/xanthine dehydrogenase FAD-binding subunit
VGVAAFIENGDGDRCRALRVVVGATTSTPQRFPDVESAAEGQSLSEALMQEIASAYADAIDPISDMRGSAWYRKQVIAALIPRAIKEAQGVNR